MKRSSFCLVIYRKQLLMLLRDNIPNLPNPNCWTLLGGRTEEGETAEQAVRREVKEEANIDLDECKYLGKFVTSVDGVAGSPNTVETSLFVSYINDEQYMNMLLGDEGQTLGLFRLEKIEQAQMGQNVKKMFMAAKIAIGQMLDGKEVDGRELGLLP